MKTSYAVAKAASLALVALLFAPITLLAFPGPGITTQPQNQSVLAGSNAVFTVVASGQTPLSYQWSFNGANLSDSAHISGATGATLTVSNVTIADYGSYQVIVSNSHGSIASSNATLTVLVPAGISSQPANQTTYFGGSASFSVSATGTAPINYRWYLNGAPLSDNGQITGSATPVLTISGAQAADIGNYKVVVTNIYGSATSLSAALNLTNSTHYVNIAGANPVPPYASWSTAATNIQDAVDVAYAGDQVIVTNGTYIFANRVTSTTTNCLVVTNAISISSVSGPAQTIINGSATNRCVFLGGRASLTGFTLMNGASSENGGGVYCQTTNENVINCVLNGNSGGVISGVGGGAYQGTLINCFLANNVADNGGGAAGSYLSNCVLTVNTATYGTAQGGGAYYCTLINCTLTNNDSFWAGGAYGSTLTGCLLGGNNAGLGGGAMASTLVSCLVTNNQAQYGGGVNNCIATNCILAGNLTDVGSTGGGGGAYNSSLYDCLLAGNRTVFAAGGSAQSCVLVNCTVVGSGVETCSMTNSLAYFTGSGNYLGTNYMSWCCVGPVTNDGAGDVVIGINNISSAPIFANATNGNYHLLPGSPGIDAGNNLFVPVAVDLDGNPRVVNGTVDMGCYEFQYSPVIEVQPANQTVTVGFPVSISVVAMAYGPAPTYQWFFNGAQISGATSPTYSINPAQYSNAGTYSVVVSNSFGTRVSSNAVLSVVAPTPPAITMQPTNQTIVFGTGVAFTASASGSPPLGYQWYLNGAPLTDGGGISGSATSTLTITNTQMNDAGSYSVTVTNSAGTAASASASLQIVPLAGWGINYFGEQTFPLTLTNVMAIATGDAEESYLNLMLKADGSVIGWGEVIGTSNYNVMVPTGLSNAAAISAGYRHGLVLENDGTVSAFGDNSVGQTNTPEGLAGVVAVSAGWDWSLALKNDGTVAAWGDNSYGEATPPPGLSNVVAISAAGVHGLALKNDGTIVGWGDNTFGMASSPAGLSNVVAIAAGYYHNLALKSDGTVVGWGDSLYGVNDIPAGVSNVIAVASSVSLSMALRNDGTVFAWGDTFYGQSPAPPGLSNVVSIAAGGEYGLALLQNPGTQVPPAIWWQGETNQTVPSGQTFLVKPYVTGSLPMSYQWFFNGAPLTGQTNAWLAINSVQTNQTGNYSFIVSNSYGSQTSAVMVVSESPGILTQPASQLVIVSNAASLSVVAAGPAPLSYQWYFAGAPLSDVDGVTGSTTANLVLSNVQTNQAGLYQCVVTNNYGSATSAAATLSVYPATTAVIQPQNIIAMAGTNVTFTATVTGQAPFSYQWQFNGANIPGATSTSITLNNLLDNQSGAYSIAVSNVTGTVVSSNALLTVVPWVTASIQPNTAVAGLYYTPVEFSLQSAGLQTNAVYQWQLNGTNLNNSWTWKNANQTNSFVPYMENAGAYDIVATDAFTFVTSSVVTLTVIPLAIITQPQPTTQTVLSGSNATFSVFASGEPTVTYQWMLNGASVPGATNSSLTLTNVTPPQAGNYSVLLSNAFTNLVSSNATLSVIPLTITSQPTNRVTWLNGSATFRVNVAGQPPFGFDWQCNGVDVPGVWTNVLTVTNVQPSQFGTYDVTISNAWGSVVSTNVTLSLSQVAVWGGLYGESNLTPGLTNVIAIAAGSYADFDCMALKSNGAAIHWPQMNINKIPTTNIIAIAGGGGPAGQGQPPFIVMERNSTVAAWLVDDIVQPLEDFTNDVAIAPDDVSLALALTANGIVSIGNEPTTPIIVTNTVSVAEGEGFYLALKADGTVYAWGNNEFGQTNVPPGLSNVVAIAAGYENGLALKSDGTVTCWGFSRYTNMPPGISNVVAIAADEFHFMALLTNGTVMAWGENIYGQTNIPPGLTNVIAIAAGPFFSMALVGNGPPVLSAPVFNPVVGTNGFSLSLPSQSGRVYLLQYKNFLTDPAWNSLPLAPGNGSTLILTDPTATNQQRFYRVLRW